MFKKKLIAFLLVSCIFNTILSSEECNKEVLKVGAILPFSGELSYFGKAFQQGFSMGLKESNQKIKIYYEDDKSGNRKEAISALRKLVSNNKINLVLVTGYPIAVVLNSIVKSNNLISL